MLHPFPVRLVSRLLCALALVGAAGQVSAQSGFDPGDPGQVLEIAKGYGSASLETYGEGKLKVDGRMEGRRYGIYFYGCTANRQCNSMQFSWGIDKKGVPLAKINDWNRDKRFAKAYLDNDGDLMLEMDVNVAYGVTRKNLDDTFDWWRLVLKEFYTTMVE
jgi:hypothetical protein